jgi:hypothetical protein
VVVKTCPQSGGDGGGNDGCDCGGGDNDDE